MHACACVCVCVRLYFYMWYVFICRALWNVVKVVGIHSIIVPGAVSFATFDFAHGSLQALGKG